MSANAVLECALGKPLLARSVVQGPKAVRVAVCMSSWSSGSRVSGPRAGRGGGGPGGFLKATVAGSGGMLAAPGMGAGTSVGREILGRSCCAADSLEERLVVAVAVDGRWRLKKPSGGVMAEGLVAGRAGCRGAVEVAMEWPGDGSGGTGGTAGGAVTVREKRPEPVRMCQWEWCLEYVPCGEGL